MSEVKKYLPLVAIYIPTFNRVELLKRAIESVLNQTYVNIEVIVVDDCSSDTTIEYLESIVLKDNRIRFFQNEKNSGACVSRNKAIIEAKGEFITGLDDDDEFTCDRIEKFLDAYDDKYAFICSDFYVQEKFTRYIAMSKESIYFDDLLWENLVGPQIFVKKERLLTLNGFDIGLPSAQDYDMWLRLVEKYGPAKRVKEPMYIMHTEHDLPRITTSSKRRKGYLMVYNKHKNSMSKKQRIYNLIIFKRIINKYIPFTWIFALFPNIYFRREVRGIILIKLPFIKKYKYFLQDIMNKKVVKK